MKRQREHCTVCSTYAVPLHERYGARVCRSCLTLFWFAEVLLESDATEAEVVPTLAFARHAEVLWSVHDPKLREATASQLVERYSALEFVKVVSGVPVLRMKPAFAELIRYEGSHLAKGVRIRVLSRFAEPHAMAQLYWNLCEREGLPIHPASPGSLSWDLDRMHLVVDVGPREEIHPTRLHQYAEYPLVRRFAFPLDTVVEALLLALLGQGQEKNQMFAACLSDLGRKSDMSLEKAIIACVLWDVHGERSERGYTKIQRSDEVAEIVNQLLLEPLGKDPITISRNNTSWRDAKKVSERFDLCKFLVQECQNRDNLFAKHLPTAP
jgi:hypothetical protein